MTDEERAELAERLTRICLDSARDARIGRIEQHVEEIRQMFAEAKADADRRFEEVFALQERIEARMDRIEEGLQALHDEFRRQR